MGEKKISYMRYFFLKPILKEFNQIIINFIRNSKFDFIIYDIANMYPI